MTRFISHLFNRHQMPHFVDHAARFWRVLQLHRVTDASKPKAPDDGRLVAVEADRADLQRHLHGATFRIGSLIHMAGAPARASSPTSLPRSRASSPGSWSVSRPAIVARTTLCGFADP